MSAGGSVTADELVRALQRQSATLPAEIATFIALEACESMLAGGPRELAGLGHVRISEAGVIALSGAACDDAHGARSLRQIHALLLAAATPGGAPPAAQGETAAGKASLEALRDELEASLVPLNRHASKRVLARFAREAARSALSREDVDAALNSLLGVGEEPANDVERQSPGSSARGPVEVSPLQVDLFEGLDLSDDEARFGAGARRDGPRATADRARDDGRRSSSRPSFLPRADISESFNGLRSLPEELVEVEPGRAGRASKLFIGFTLVGLAVAVVAFALSVRSAREGETPADSGGLALESERVGTPRGDLVVHVSEANAQVLRLIGHAPVEVAQLPVGAAHEFVATATGHRPARVLVPADAEWESTPGGARYEVALQLGEHAATPDDALDLGPSRLVAPASGQPTRRGTVRVVATPRGASIYQLIGFSPNVRVEDLPLTGNHELLVYRERFRPVIRTLSPEDFRERDGRRVAELHVELTKR